MDEAKSSSGHVDLLVLLGDANNSHVVDLAVQAVRLNNEAGLVTAIRSCGNDHGTFDLSSLQPRVVLALAPPAASFPASIAKACDKPCVLVPCLVTSDAQAWKVLSSEFTVENTAAPLARVAVNGIREATALIHRLLDNARGAAASNPDVPHPPRVAPLSPRTTQAVRDLASDLAAMSQKRDSIQRDIMNLRSRLDKLQKVEQALMVRDYARNVQRNLPVSPPDHFAATSPTPARTPPSTCSSAGLSPPWREVDTPSPLSFCQPAIATTSPVAANPLTLPPPPNQVATSPPNQVATSPPNQVATSPPNIATTSQQGGIAGVVAAAAEQATSRYLSTRRGPMANSPNEAYRKIIELRDKR